LWQWVYTKGGKKKKRGKWPFFQGEATLSVQKNKTGTNRRTAGGASFEKRGGKRGKKEVFLSRQKANPLKMAVRGKGTKDGQPTSGGNKEGEEVCPEDSVRILLNSPRRAG